MTWKPKSIAVDVPNISILQNLSETQGGVLEYKGNAIGTGGGSNTYNITVLQSDINAAQFNIYNVKDNGVVGNGVTDDRVKMQALVDAISALGGGTIYAPKGTYFIGGYILWKSNVSLIGDGKDLTIFKSAGNSAYSVFYQVNAETKNIRFEGFTVDGYGVVTSSYFVQSKAFFFQKVTNGIFRDLKLVGTGASALGIDFLQDVIIDNITTVDCGRQWNTGDPGGAGIGIGTGTYPIENLQIINCKCYNSGQYGIFLEHQGMFAGGKEKAKGVIISNNVVQGGRNHGIGVKGGQNITLIGNEIYENTGHGIYLYGASVVNTDLEKIKVVSNTVSENGKDGIFLENISNVSDLLISNNLSSRNTGNGITVPAGASGTYDKIFIVNNTITDNSGTDIFVGDATITNLRIKDNISVNNKKTSGKLIMTYANAYAQFPYQILESGANDIILQFKISSFAAKCLMSRKNTDFKTSNKPEGFAISTTASGNIKISGYKANDGTLFSYTYTDVLTAAQKYYLKISYKGVALSVSYSTDGTTYTVMTLDTATAVGADTDIIALLSSSALTYPINIGREWVGSSGWTNNYTGLVCYILKTNNTNVPNDSYEYRFFNVGFNKEVYEIKGSGLNGKSGLGCKQAANEVV